MSGLFLGIDIGTSGVKAVLVRESGEVAASATSPLTISTPQPGWAEQNPDDWWTASASAARAALAKAPGANVSAVGLSGQMHSSVFLDRASQVVRPALLWCDGRTTAECREITERAGGEAKLREWVCNPAIEGFTLPKVLWLRNHEPDAFARVAKVILAKDYIRFRLTGVLASEPSDDAGTLMFDPARRAWSEPMMKAVGLPMSLLVGIGGSSEVLGAVSGEAEALTGIPAGTPVVGGGSDNACGAAGVGVIDPGEAVASWGTSGTVLAPTSEPRVDPGLRAHTFCHVTPDRWYIIGVVLSAGSAWAWFRDQLARDLIDAPTRQRANAPTRQRANAPTRQRANAPTRQRANALLNEEAATAPPGAEGVRFAPYLQGERTPWRDASLRGAFTGISLAHTRAHLARAVLEGICYALKDSLSILEELKLSPKQLLLTGGGARSDFVRRLQAEIFGLPVCLVNREEGSAYGAALLAAVGAGAFPDLQSAARATLSRTAPERPDPAAVKRYAELYAARPKP